MDRTLTEENKGDWVAWHDAYDASGSALRQRLQIVIGHVAAALAKEPVSPVPLISMCAGQARDIRGALERITRRDIVGRLVEMDARLAEEARRGLDALGARGLEVVVGDAGELSAYEGAAPANLVLACGVFGNISDTDIERTVRALPALCAPGATVIWTRHRRAPDRTVDIRRWLAEAEFDNTSSDPVDDPLRPGSVGVAVFRGATLPLTPGRLFTFA